MDRGKQHVSYPCPNVLKRVIPPRSWGMLAVANAGGGTSGSSYTPRRPGGHANWPKMVG